MSIVRLSATFNFSSGAIKRSSLEKDHPPITYEAFIEELDEGDSFTASMFDLLVKVSNGIMTHPSYLHVYHYVPRNLRRGVSATILTANILSPPRPLRAFALWPPSPGFT